jgi:electron transport complex protein RnfB
MPSEEPRITRRRLLIGALRGAGLIGAGTLAGRLLSGADRAQTRWQIDPDKCVACGNCATYCVLTPSAVKCVHAFALCGRCNFCFGYYETAPGVTPGDGVEHQVCPLGAIRRTFLREPYYEYTIDEGLCIGCAKCVKGCSTFGNGSLFLQVRHDRCVNCNECAIAAACPSGAFRRVPAGRPYLLKEA